MKFVVVLRFLGFICVIHLSGKSQFIAFLNLWAVVERVGFEVKHKCKFNGPRLCLNNIPQ